MHLIVVNKLWRTGDSWQGHPDFAFSWATPEARGIGRWVLGSKATSIKLSKGKKYNHTRYKDNHVRLHLLYELLRKLVALEPETANNFFRQHFSVDNIG